jgi:hypothetical protein
LGLVGEHLDWDLVSLLLPLSHARQLDRAGLRKCRLLRLFKFRTLWHAGADCLCQRLESILMSDTLEREPSLYVTDAEVIRR